MEDKNNTVFVQKYEYENTSDLLNEILRRLERFCYFSGYEPSNIKMTAKQYYEILNYNPSLIARRENEGYYILGMKVVF
jgi:hypothetical protein